MMAAKINIAVWFDRLGKTVVNTVAPETNADAT